MSLMALLFCHSQGSKIGHANFALFILASPLQRCAQWSEIKKSALISVLPFLWWHSAASPPADDATKGKAAQQFCFSSSVLWLGTSNGLGFPTVSPRPFAHCVINQTPNARMYGTPSLRSSPSQKATWKKGLVSKELFSFSSKEPYLLFPRCNRSHKKFMIESLARSSTHNQKNFFCYSLPLDCYTTR